MIANLAIRPMTAADLDAVAALAATLREAPHWPLSVYRDALNPAFTPRRIAMVAAAAQSAFLLGFAIASLVAPQAELEAVAVAAQNQRQGVGRHLLHALASELAAAGATELLLEVRASNQAALSLYRSLGFVATGRRPGYYRNPAEDAVLLRHNLG